MQSYTIFVIAANTLHVQAVFRPSSGAQICRHSIWYMSSLLAATASVGELEIIAASKLDISQMTCVQFRAPDDGRKNRLKHVQHWQQ